MSTRTPRHAALAASLAAGLALAAPAAGQAAANPYSPQRACTSDFGGTWVPVKNNHRAVKTKSGEKWGDVYLMYRRSDGSNCAATIKSKFVGKPTWTEAWLAVHDGPDWTPDWKAYQYYAAVKIPARKKCVVYFGRIYRAATKTGAFADGGRLTNGNCG
jgi:hypothetical protein